MKKKNKKIVEELGLKKLSKKNYSMELYLISLRKEDKKWVVLIEGITTKFNKIECAIQHIRAHMIKSIFRFA